MSVTINTFLSRAVRPREVLSNGAGNFQRGTAFSVYDRTVGAARFASSGVVTSAWGKPTQVAGDIHFHFRMMWSNAAQGFVMEGWLSNGVNCDDALVGLHQGVLDFLDSGNYRVVSLKKKDNGSIGKLALSLEAPVGNYIKIFSVEASDTRFDENYDDLTMFYGPLFSEADLVMNSFKQLREGTFHFKPTVNHTLRLNWVPAYNPEAAEECLWLLDSKGDMVSEIRIYETEVRGSRLLPVIAGNEYRLVIPGYSCRNYEIEYEQDTFWVWEPVKIHWMGQMPSNTRYYFNLEPNEAATFCMKDYNRTGIEAPYGATLTRLWPDAEVDVTVTPLEEFHEHHRFDLPVTDSACIWRVDMKGGGRTGIWLDGVPNLLSQRSSKYFRPTYLDNDMTATVPSFAPASSIGKVPLIGLYHGFQMLNKGGSNLGDLFQRVKPQTTNMYTYLEVIDRDGPEAVDRYYREAATSTYNMKRDYTICAMLGRVSDLDYVNNPVCTSGLNKFLDNIATINDGQEHYLTSTDEPNLAYETYEEYRTQFKAFADIVKAHPDSAAQQVKLYGPASSRFTQGTTIGDAVNRRGFDWGKRLVEDHPDLVDAIVWHDWTVHNVLSIRQYGNEIEKAYTLSDNGARRLCIEQTNTSGGASVSSYDQETQIATLWWCGAIIAAIRTGKLDDIIWFLDQDDTGHPKGMFKTNWDAEDPMEWYSMKIVAYFQEWLIKYVNDASIGKAYDIEQPKLELDLTAFTNEKGGVTRSFILGANKAPRNYAVHLDNFNWGNGSNVKLEYFLPNGTPVVHTPTINVGNQTIDFVVPAETVFMLSKDFVE